MPEKPASERTEKPTDERLKKAREEGQFAQSQEVPSAFVIGLLVVMLVLMASRLSQWFISQLHEGLTLHMTGSMDSGMFAELMNSRGTECLTILAPFLAAAACISFFGSALVGGLSFAPKALRLDLKRISPIKGIKNLFSLKSVVKLLISIVKLVVLLTIAWQYLSGRLDTLVSLQWAAPEGILCGIAGLILGLAGRIVVALLAIAGADMLYQRWNYKRQLRMTRQEVKEERKQHEVSPEVKGRVRAMQLAMARKRMLQEVPNADVVVTNPTHYAVALRYDAKTMNAPEVVAKGADFLCEKIKEIAAENDIPVVEKPELARALYSTAEVGQAIPEVLFVAVAEILAMIYRMRKNRGRKK